MTKPKVKKAGRPPVPEAERRGYELRVRLNVAERETLEGAAEELEVDLSTWLRELGLKAAKRLSASAKES